MLYNIVAGASIDSIKPFLRRKRMPNVHGPLRIVVGRHDHLLGANKAARVLPAARLPVDVEPADAAAAMPRSPNCSEALLTADVSHLGAVEYLPMMSISCLHLTNGSDNQEVYSLDGPLRSERRRA